VISGPCGAGGEEEACWWLDEIAGCEDAVSHNIQKRGDAGREPMQHIAARKTTKFMTYLER